MNRFLKHFLFLSMLCLSSFWVYAGGPSDRETEEDIAQDAVNPGRPLASPLPSSPSGSKDEVDEVDDLIAVYCLDRLPIETEKASHDKVASAAEPPISLEFPMDFPNTPEQHRGTQILNLAGPDLISALSQLNYNDLKALYHEAGYTFSFSDLLWDSPTYKRHLAGSSAPEDQVRIAIIHQKQIARDLYTSAMLVKESEDKASLLIESQRLGYKKALIQLEKQGILPEKMKRFILEGVDKNDLVCIKFYSALMRAIPVQSLADDSQPGPAAPVTTDIFQENSDVRTSRIKEKARTSIYFMRLYLEGLRDGKYGFTQDIESYHALLKTRDEQNVAAIRLFLEDTVLAIGKLTFRWTPEQKEKWEDFLKITNSYLETSSDHPWVVKAFCVASMEFLGGFLPALSYI